MSAASVTMPSVKLKENVASTERLQSKSPAHMQTSHFSKPIAPGRKASSITPGRVSSSSSGRKPLQKLTDGLENASPRTPTRIPGSYSLDTIAFTHKKRSEHFEGHGTATPAERGVDSEMSDEREAGYKREISVLERQNKDIKREIELNRIELTKHHQDLEDNNRQLLEARRDLVAKEKKIEDAKNARESAEQRTEELQLEIDTFRKKIAHLHEGHQKDSQIIHERALEIKMLNSSLEEALSRRDELQRKLPALVREVEALKAQHLEDLQRHESIKNDRDRLQQERDELRKTTTEQQRIIHDLGGLHGSQERLAVLTSQHTTLQAACDRLQSEKQDLENRLMTFQKELLEAKTIQDTFQLQSEKHSTELAKVREQILQKESALVASQQHIALLTKALRTSEGQLEEVNGPEGPRAKLREMQNAHLTQASALAEAQANERTLQQEVQALKEDVSSLQEKCQELHSGAQASKAYINDHEMKKRQLENQLEASRAQTDQLREIIRLHEITLSELRGPNGPIAKLEAATLRLAEIEEVLEHTRQDRQDQLELSRALQEQVDQYEGEKHILERDLHQLSIKESSLQTDTEAQEELLRQARDKILTLTAELAKIQSALDSSRDGQQKHDEQLEEVLAEQHALQDALGVANRTAASLEEARVRSEQEIETARQEKQGLLLELQKLREDHEVTQNEALDHENECKAMAARIAVLESRMQDTLQAAEKEARAAKKREQDFDLLKSEYDRTCSMLSTAEAAKIQLAQEKETCQFRIKTLSRENEVLAKRLENVKQTTELVKDKQAVMSPLQNSKTIGSSRLSLRPEGQMMGSLKQWTSHHHAGVLRKACRYRTPQERFVWITPFQPFIFWSSGEGKGKVRRARIDEAWRDQCELHVLGERTLTFYANSEGDAEEWCKILLRQSRYRPIPHPGGRFSSSILPASEDRSRYASRTTMQQDSKPTSDVLTKQYLH